MFVFMFNFLEKKKKRRKQVLVCDEQSLKSSSKKCSPQVWWGVENLFCVCVRVQLNKQFFLWHIEFPFPVYATWQETNTEKDQLQEVSIFLDCTVNYFSCWSLWAPHPSTPLKEGKESKKLGVLHQISQCGYIRVIPKEEKKEEKFTKKELEIVFFCFFLSIEQFWFWMWFN